MKCDPDLVKEYKVKNALYFVEKLSSEQYVDCSLFYTHI